MADLASSAVTLVRSWSEGGPAGKDLSGRLVQLVLTGQGTATNKIPASVLGLSKIEQAGPFVKSDDTVGYVGCPDYAGANLLLMTENTGLIPTDATGTFRGVVKGYL